MKILGLVVLLNFAGIESGQAASGKDVWVEQIPTNNFDHFETSPFTAFAVALPPGAEIFAKSNAGSFFRAVVAEEGDADFSELLFVPGSGTASAIALRADNFAGDFLTVHFFNTKITARGPVVASTTNSMRNLIVSRADWGANESLRFVENGKTLTHEIEEKETGKQKSKSRAKACGVLRNFHPEEFQLAKVQKTEKGKELLWPFQFSERIFKVVLHHTAETGVSDGRSPTEVMRGLYRYHAVTRGWGDIGYHFVIDPLGQIFEGRAGGDFVVGGHVFCNNIGTIGVALMGNFQEQEPTGKQLAALKKLLPALAKNYELDLTDREVFHDKNLPNLIGHRDLAPTACPGENFYRKLEQVRRDIAGTAEIQFAKSRKYAAQLENEIEALQIEAGKTHKMQIRFRNTGNVPWRKSNTWLYVFHGEQTQVNVRSAIAGRRYVAAKLLENEVDAGEVGTFNVQLSTGFQGGLFTLAFAPVVNSKKINSGAFVQPVEIIAPIFKAKVKSMKVLPAKPLRGDRISTSLRLANQGNTMWRKDLITLQVSSGQGREKLEVSLNQNVAPGNVGKFVFSIPAFQSVGRKALIFTLRLEGEKITSAKPIIKVLEIFESGVLAQPLQAGTPTTLAQVGKPVTLDLQFANQNIFPWARDTFFLKSPSGKRIDFLENEVAPKQTATFRLETTVQAPGLQAMRWQQKSGQKNLQSMLWLVRGLSNVKDSLHGRTFFKQGRAATVEKKAATDFQIAAGNLANNSANVAENFSSESAAAGLPTENSGAPFQAVESAGAGLPTENSGVDLPLANASEKSTRENSFRLESENEIAVKLSFAKKVATIETVGGKAFMTFSNGEKLGYFFQVKIAQKGEELVFVAPARMRGAAFASLTFQARSAESLLQVANWHRLPGWNQTGEINDNQFAGSIEARIFNGKLVLINHLPLEQYLQGVAESPESNHFQKQKTMAVLARNYAKFYLDPNHRKFPAAPFDLDDSPQSCQKYLGAGFSQRAPRWVQAVRETAGMVVTFQGKLIKTPYFHSSDGRTRSAQEVWGWADAPFLQSVPDPAKGDTLQGHGVGLSGNGAQVLAENGQDFEQIIKYFFTGVEIEKP